MTTPNLDKVNCRHKNVGREKGRWGATGDYICHDCGEVFTSKTEMEAAQSERQNISLKKKKRE